MTNAYIIPPEKIPAFFRRAGIKPSALILSQLGKNWQQAIIRGFEDEFGGGGGKSGGLLLDARNQVFTYKPAWNGALIKNASELVGSVTTRGAHSGLEWRQEIYEDDSEIPPRRVAPKPPVWMNESPQVYWFNGRKVSRDEYYRLTREYVSPEQVYNNANQTNQWGKF